MMIIMMIMLMPSVFSGTYLMIIMMTSILYLMSLLLAFISNKITPMFDLDVVIQFRAWRPALNPSRVQQWRCHHYHNHHHHRHCYHHHHHSHTQTYNHDDNIDDNQVEIQAGRRRRLLLWAVSRGLVENKSFSLEDWQLWSILNGGEDDFFLFRSFWSVLLALSKES